MCRAYENQTKLLFPQTELFRKIITRELEAEFLVWNAWEKIFGSDRMEKKNVSVDENEQWKYRCVLMTNSEIKNRRFGWTIRAWSECISVKYRRAYLI